MVDMKAWLVKYNELKDAEKKLKAELGDLGDGIKAYLTTHELEEFSHEGLKISYKPTEKSTVNEQLLIKTLKKLATKEKDAGVRKSIRACIKKVEAIDETNLETLIYNGIIPSEELEKCTENKTIYTLRLGKVKVSK